MLHAIRPAALAAALAALAAPAAAATLQPPVAAASDATLFYAEVDDGATTLAELTVFGSVDRFDGVSDLAGAGLSLLFGYPVAGSPDAAEGVLSINRGAEILLSATTGAISVMNGELVIALDALDGTAGAGFEPEAAARLAFELDLGDDPLAALDAADPYAVSVAIGRLPGEDGMEDGMDDAPGDGMGEGVTPIPAPAALPLLASAVLLGGLWRRLARG
jgi:hypothetical protein